MFDGASSLQTLDLSSWDTFAFQTAGGFGWLAMQDMLRGTSSLWKITLGPNTFLAALSDFGGTVVIQNAPGNNQKIGDSDERHSMQVLIKRGKWSGTEPITVLRDEK